MKRLRYYQTEAKEAILGAWKQGVKNPLVSMATGTGKALSIADLSKEICQNSTDNILALVHSKELVGQNAMEMIGYWPDAPIGINSAGLGRRDRHQRILFSSIQTVYNKFHTLGPRRKIIVDECHLISTSGSGMYRSLFEAALEADPDTRIAGFTATPFRLGHGRIDQGEGAIFDATVYDYDIGRGIGDGFLAPLTCRGTDARINTAGLKKVGGEFQDKDLSRVANDNALIRRACDEIITKGALRKKWIVFCVDVQHAEAVTARLVLSGVAAEAVHSKTFNRSAAIERFKAGHIRALVSVNILTTGFNVPGVDLMAMLRPTASTSLYLQMAGRGTRPVYSRWFDASAATADERRANIAMGEKPNCLVLDFAGNVRRLGPVDQPLVKQPRKKNEEDPLCKECPNCACCDIPMNAQSCHECGFTFPKECPMCGAEVERSVMLCECGFDFTPKAFEAAPAHDERADVEAVILSSDKTPEQVSAEEREKAAKKLARGASTSEEATEFLVMKTVLSKHEKPGKAPSLRVDYHCGGRLVISEWVFLESEHSSLKSKARMWWRRLSSNVKSPETVDLALEAALFCHPVFGIRAKKDKDNFWRIESHAVVIDGNVHELSGIGRADCGPVPEGTDCEALRPRTDGAPVKVALNFAWKDAAKARQDAHLDSVLDDDIPF